MKSQTSLAARNCRLQEWSKMVHSCNNRPIGMSVDEWCRENSITTANYYYRMTQVRKTCLDSLSDEAVNQEVVSVPTSIQCLSPAKKYRLYALGVFWSGVNSDNVIKYIRKFV